MYNLENHSSHSTYSIIKILGKVGALFVVLMVTGSTASFQSVPIELDPIIFQKWLHSYEEDTKDIKIYRPSSFNFPRGWGRSGMKIDKNGGFILFDIAPNDAIVQIPGKWHQISDGKLEISFPAGEKDDITIEIEELNTEILKVKK